MIAYYTAQVSSYSVCSVFRWTPSQRPGQEVYLAWLHVAADMVRSVGSM